MMCAARKVKLRDVVELARLRGDRIVWEPATVIGVNEDYFTLRTADGQNPSYGDSDEGRAWRFPGPPPDLKRVTLDSLVTATKLAGSAQRLNGFTKPEGFPFVIICAVASPGNEAVLGLADEFGEGLAKRGAAVARIDWEEFP